MALKPLIAGSLYQSVSLRPLLAGRYTRAGGVFRELVGGLYFSGASVSVPVPVNTVAPALDDTSPGVGDTVTCSTGTWTNTPTSYAYQWRRDAASIGGATNNSYLVDAADEGAILTCAVTASNAGGDGSPELSNATDPIPGGFTPPDIAGCVLWLDASQIVGLNDGDPVSTWADESGEGNSATQAGGSRPTYQTNEINGLPVVSFDGSDDSMNGTDLALSQPFTLFAVLKITATTNAGLFDSSSPRAILAGFNSVQLWASTFACDSGFSTIAASPPAVFSAIFNGASSELRVDGGSAATGNPGANGMGTYVMGKYSDSAIFASVDFAEVVIYDTALSTMNRQTVETYLMDKYGL